MPNLQVVQDAIGAARHTLVVLSLRESCVRKANRPLWHPRLTTRARSPRILGRPRRGRLRSASAGPPVQRLCARASGEAPRARASYQEWCLYEIFETIRIDAAVTVVFNAVEKAEIPLALKDTERLVRTVNTMLVARAALPTSAACPAA